MHLSERIENQKVGNEKEGHTIDELEAADAACDKAVQRHNAQEQQSLTGGCVAFDDGASFRKDQRLTHCFDDEIGSQEQKEIKHQKQSRGAFACPHL